METTKPDSVINDIVYKITHNELSAGDTVLSRNYDTSAQTMAVVFKALSEKGIVERSAGKSYILTDECIENAQEYYLEKIIKAIAVIKHLARTADIPLDILNDIIKEELGR